MEHQPEMRRRNFIPSSFITTVHFQNEMMLFFPCVLSNRFCFAVGIYFSGIYFTGAAKPPPTEMQQRGPSTSTRHKWSQAMPN